MASANVGDTHSVKLGKLPDNAAVIFSSMRWKPDRKKPVTWELYASDRECENFERITYREEGPGYLHAAVSPDHRYVAAISGQVEPDHFWLYDLERKTETELVPDFKLAGVGGMDWSPDGYLYFAGGKKRGELDIYRMRIDGSGLAQLTHTDELETDVSVSRDGTMVAYARTTFISGKPKPQIWVMGSDGKNQRMVFDGGPELGVHGNIPIGAFDPTLSPDEKRVVFAVTNPKSDNFGWGAYDIWVSNVDGSGARDLTPGTTSIKAIPDWNQNGILYSEIDERGKYIGLVTMESVGAKPQRLESGMKEMWDGGRHPKWIPPLDSKWSAGTPDDVSRSAPSGDRAEPSFGGGDVSAGTADRKVAGGIQYLPAAFGTGFLADQPGEIITYPTANHIDPERGSIELRIRVDESLDDGLEWNPLFIAQEEPSQPLRGFIVQFIRHTKALVFVAGSLKENAVLTGIGWKKGSDHYIAATWGDAGLRLYVDGELAAESKKRPGIRRLPERMSAGGYIWTQAKNPSDTIIDELRISSVERSASEVREIQSSRRPFVEDDRTLLLDHFDR
jgi:Concanavalin A-like lectin/glucanases superfamily/WD40-like Beta Propeller Repeat